MNILYYTWNENSKIDMVETLRYMGHRVIICQIPFCSYEEDAEFTQGLEKMFCDEHCDIFLSFNFFPLIAKLAEKMKKKYISWVYDTPHRTLYSPSVRGEYIYLYLFDKVLCQQIKELGAKHVFHMPLAANTRRLNKQLGMLDTNVNYDQDVSFVGSLYEDNMFQKIHYLPEYISGYLNGIVNAQRMIYGYNLVDEVLGQDMVDMLCKVVKLDLDKTYLWNEKQIYVDMLNAEVTHQERVHLLKKVSELFDFKLYTNSEAKEFPEKALGGILSYGEQMPEVFRRSKINLNITLRSITSGIPLRAIDIMGAGGFLLSNYQPELAEYFIDGEDMVLFESCEDMLFKIAYYLEHEEERKRIALNGWRKVQELYSYEIQLGKILDCCRSEIARTKKKEVVFLPYKASMWDSLESVWKAADEDPECEAYVIPIPYYDKNADGTFGELHYEIDQYPKYVPVLSYEEYNLELRHPAQIFIHNPYDACNHVTSVHPYFYAKNLKQYTDELIYIPYFVLNEIDPRNSAAVQSIEDFVLVPGVIYADKVIVQSEKMCEAYIKALTNAAGEQTREIWEKKILGLGSPKYDKISNMKREEIETPEDWLRIIQKPDGSRKKVILYNTSVKAFLEHKEQMLKKIQSALAIFKENQEDVALLWRPHPLMKATICATHPQLWEGYDKIVKQYQKEGWGIYDDTADLDRAIIISDAYYGDPSSVVQLCRTAGLPVMIQNVYCD